MERVIRNVNLFDCVSGGDSVLDENLCQITIRLRFFRCWKTRYMTLCSRRCCWLASRSLSPHSVTIDIWFSTFRFLSKMGFSKAVVVSSQVFLKDSKYLIECTETFSVTGSPNHPRFFQLPEIPVDFFTHSIEDSVASCFQSFGYQHFFYLVIVVIDKTSGVLGGRVCINVRRLFRKRNFTVV